MTQFQDDKALWRRASSPSRLAPHPEQPASPPSRLASLAPQDEDAGWRRTLAPQDEEEGSERALRPHPEVRPKRASKGEVATKRPSKDEDLLTLSTWLDGRLEDGEREAVEARLAAEPRFLELALAAAEARGLAAPWPKRAQTRAAGLLAPAGPSLRVVAAAAAAILLVALGGFELGRFGWQSLAEGAQGDLAAELGLIPDPDLLEIVL